MAVMGGELVANNDVSVVETSARSVETAITQALAELGRARNEVTVSIIDPGNPGRILGFGAQPARVRVSVRDRKSTRLNSSHEWISRMPSSA